MVKLNPLSLDIYRNAPMGISLGVVVIVTMGGRVLFGLIPMTLLTNWTVRNLFIYFTIFYWTFWTFCLLKTFFLLFTCDLSHSNCWRNTKTMILWVSSPRPLESTLGFGMEIVAAAATSLFDTCLHNVLLALTNRPKACNGSSSSTCRFFHLCQRQRH